MDGLAGRTRTSRTGSVAAADAAGSEAGAGAAAASAGDQLGILLAAGKDSDPGDGSRVVAAERRKGPRAAGWIANPTEQLVPGSD